MLPIFDDNYVFFIVRTDSKTCVIVDPGSDFEVDQFLRAHGLKLEAILLTHHHDDHIGGAYTLKEKWNVPVYAPLKNKTEIPFATHYVSEGEEVSFLQDELTLDVIELSGHTHGHVGFVDRKRAWLFSGDVLFGLGCGRLFEGTFEEGYKSLQKIKKLADNTLVYCTHEYTESNLRFCKTLSPTESPELFDRLDILRLYEEQLIEKRRSHLPSVPLRLAMEKSINPFLLAPDLVRFKKLRELKNQR
jgi:hydroxyacylglutathione hydrolase